MAYCVPSKASSSKNFVGCFSYLVVVVLDDAVDVEDVDDELSVASLLSDGGAAAVVEEPVL